MRVASGHETPLALIVCLYTCFAAQGATASEHATAVRTFGNDVFLAGSNVRVSNGSAGDAVLAGGSCRSLRELAEPWEGEDLRQRSGCIAAPTIGP